MGFDPISFLLGSKAGGGGGGGSSPWTKLAEQDFTVSTTSTTATNIGTIAAGASAWTSAKMIYVRVRDKAGKRNRYFYGVDQFFVNANVANGITTDYTKTFVQILSLNASGEYIGTASASPSGVYANSISSTGDIAINSKYITYTVDGTYHVEVYTLEWPDNVSPFE